MQTIQHATNLPYIPQYTIWNYAMEHPVLFFMMICFVVLVIGHVFDNTLRVISAKALKPITIVNNKGE